MSSPRELIDSVLARNHLFAGLDDGQRAALASRFMVERIPACSQIVEEGDKAEKLYVVLEGRVDVGKRGQAEGESQHLATLSAGDVFGEMAVLESAARSATVRAATDVVLASLSRKSFQELQAAERTPFNQMIFNLARNLSARLRHTSEITVVALQNELKSAQARSAMGRLIIYTILLMTFYHLLLNTLAAAVRDSACTACVSVGAAAAIATGLLALMRSSGFPLWIYGFRLGSWKRELFPTLLVTAGLCLGATLAKWVLIQLVPAMGQLSVFQLSFGQGMGEAAGVDPGRGILVALLFGVFAVVQEIIVRGALQSAFQEFLTGRFRLVWAVVLSNAMLGALHLHLSPLLAALAMTAGLVWGWMYARQRSLIGVMLSHLLVGWYGLFILGVERFVK